MRDGELCLMHDPEHADTVAEGRRLGGTNRKREALLTAGHDFEGLGSTVQRQTGLAGIALIRGDQAFSARNGGA